MSRERYRGARFDLDADDAAVAGLQDEVDFDTGPVSEVVDAWSGLGPLALRSQLARDESLDETTGKVGIGAQTTAEQSRGEPGIGDREA